ncbi:MAG TPA: GntR family transcriptional regulator [Longimicrobiales bacterium]
MLIRIRPEDARPIYVQIMDEVRRARMLGLVGPDEPLPSVRHLAMELRVNPNTVQQAYRELERSGVVYVQRGQGTYVADGGVPKKERRRLLKAVALRAVRDANRHGFTAAELISAIEEEEGS